MSESAKRWAKEALFNMSEQLKTLWGEMAQIDVDMPEVDETVTAAVLCDSLLKSTEFNIFLMECFLEDL